MGGPLGFGASGMGVASCQGILAVAIRDCRNSSYSASKIYYEQKHISPQMYRKRELLAD